MSKRQKHDEAVVVLRTPFKPNVSLIRESLTKYYGNVTPRPAEALPSSPPSTPPVAKAI